MDTINIYHGTAVLMRRMRHILVFCLTLLLTAAGVGSCDFRELESEVPMLNIWIYVDQPMLTKAGPVTKADEGTIAVANAAEKDIHSLQIWVFKHDNGELITYLTPSISGLDTGGEKRFSTPIKKAFADAAAAAGGGLEVDVYALANGASAGVNFNRDTPRSTLASAAIADPYFGTANLTTAADIAADGLPMSVVATQTLMTGSELQFEIATVKLTRAVSKVRFVFCQSAEVVNSVLTPTCLNAEITSIQINSGMIPTQEYLFNDTANPYSVGGPYNATAFPIPLPTTIPLCASPPAYVYNPQRQTAQQYETIIDQAVTAGNLSQVGQFYLRESDQAITGTISYKMTNPRTNVVESKTATFSMDLSAAGQYNFSRNHSWIVYAYLSDSKLYINPYILPWNWVSEIEYSTKIVTGLHAAEPYRRYDTDSDPGLFPDPTQPSDPAYQSWAGSHVLVSYGYMNSNDQPVATPGVNDRPMYARRIVLYTWAPGTDFQLNVNNPNFKFVTYDEETQTYDHSLSGGEPLIITGSDYIDNSVNPPVLLHGVAYTYFYVVPVSTMPVDATLEQRTCHVYLTTVATSIGSVKLAFNNSALPGYSGASDEIWFYYSAPDVYNTTGILVDNI